MRGINQTPAIAKTENPNPQYIIAAPVRSKVQPKLPRHARNAMFSENESTDERFSCGEDKSRHNRAPNNEGRGLMFRNLERYMNKNADRYRACSGVQRALPPVGIKIDR